MFPLSVTAFQLVLHDLGREERTTENMDMADGLLLQVNNGEQWCNRWKYPSDDLVSKLYSQIVASLQRLCPYSFCHSAFQFDVFFLLLQGPKHQPVCPALCGEHMERRSAEQEEAICRPLLSLLYTAELGNVTLRLINANLSSEFEGII